ncbi:DUF3285 domain-containing protein [Stenomitos frigidus]|uniref:DUF3285 domain-containing protein n=1 Tax=Stenomitos frigidus ULC18 TaxID=2107698 RepID=A0A2T1E2Q1_9CYAN|nr:DUF3285 domain-containing protein [Stenomitos frigidus]PSB27032.1 DUF3285 domain-containing protein [Stenomitos frigidus ULC18]
METQNASSEANVSEPVETAPEPSTIHAELGAEDSATPINTEAAATEPKPSYVKLAMRNMVRKRGLSLQHFALTTIGLVAFLVGLSYLTR